MISKFSPDRFQVSSHIQDVIDRTTHDSEQDPKTQTQAGQRKGPLLPGERFVNKVPLFWLRRVCLLGFSPLKVGLALWLKQGFAGWRDGAVNLRLSSKDLRDFDVRSDAKVRALRKLAAAGLIEFVQQKQGACAVVRILLPRS